MIDLFKGEIVGPKIVGTLWQVQLDKTTSGVDIMYLEFPANVTSTISTCSNLLTIKSSTGSTLDTATVLGSSHTCAVVAAADGKMNLIKVTLATGHTVTKGSARLSYVQYGVQ